MTDAFAQIWKIHRDKGVPVGGVFGSAISRRGYVYQPRIPITPHKTLCLQPRSLQNEDSSAWPPSSKLSTRSRAQSCTVASIRFD